MAKKIKIEPSVKQKKNGDIKKIIILIGIIATIIAIIVGIVILFLQLKTTNKELEITKEELHDSQLDTNFYKERYESADRRCLYKTDNDCAESFACTKKYLSYKIKSDFLDENIVFVLKGYGNYYYSYDCVQKITDGDYTYWAYNKEAAKADGYKAGKC